MRVWRICRRPHAAASLTGSGGLHVSGRWHHRGRPIVYTSASPSLAALEVPVHVDPALAPTDLRLIEIDIPEGIAIEACDPARLVTDWQVFPAPVALQDFGSEWLSDLRTPVLSVPSAVLAIERDLTINPAHPDAPRIRVVHEQAFSFDPRLIS
jgi:RES domain-containing protein